MIDLRCMITFVACRMLPAFATHVRCSEVHALRCLFDRRRCREWWSWVSVAVVWKWDLMWGSGLEGRSSCALSSSQPIEKSPGWNTMKNGLARWPPEGNFLSRTHVPATVVQTSKIHQKIRVINTKHITWKLFLELTLNLGFHIFILE